MLTYHLVPRDEYDPATPTYAPPAYAAEGFIHTTRTLAIVHEVANRYYRADPRPYLLLTVDLERERALALRRRRAGLPAPLRPPESRGDRRGATGAARRGWHVPAAES